MNFTILLSGLLPASLLLHPNLNPHLPPNPLFTSEEIKEMPSRIDWHEGERAVHHLLHAPTPHQNPTSAGLPRPYAARIGASPLVALGTVDGEGRPWTSVWGGERGFAQGIAAGVLGVSCGVCGEDPVFVELWRGSEAGVVRPGEGGGGRVVSGLGIDLEVRDRVKFGGRMVAGAVTSDGGAGACRKEIQMGVVVRESLGNCPKYLNKKRITPAEMNAVVASRDLPLPEDAVELIDRADLFFISSVAGEGEEMSMDTNHRGGPRGFVRVVRNDHGGVVLVYPEYSGNRLYQTLGNMKLNPKAGIVFPDFETGDALYVTGDTSILVGTEASALLPRTKVAIQITVTSSLFLKSGLPFRGAVIDYSPYNPPVRHLASEQPAHFNPAGDTSAISTKFLRREHITPTIARFTFALETEGDSTVTPWKSGQDITLDFGPELDMGWEHMRDADPQSLNDDFIRTFTISSPAPSIDHAQAGVKTGTEIQITARKHGPATGFLWNYNPRVDLTLPVLGFGGEDKFLMSTTRTDRTSVFIAGGVGITPLLSQVKGMLASGSPLKVLWSLRGEDLGFAEDSFRRVDGLAAKTRIFVTGKEVERQDEVEGRLRGMGAEVSRGRMGKDRVISERHVDGDGESGRKFFVCAGVGLMKLVLGWLDGEEVVYESFGY